MPTRQSPSSRPMMTLWTDSNDVHFERWKEHQTGQPTSRHVNHSSYLSYYPETHRVANVPPVRKEGIAKTLSSPKNKRNVLDGSSPSPSSPVPKVEDVPAETRLSSRVRHGDEGPPLHSASRFQTTASPSNHTETSELSSLAGLATSVVCDIFLPQTHPSHNKTTLSVPQMIRLLLEHLPHATLQQNNGRLWQYVRGSHLLEILFELFFQDKKGVEEDEVIAFGWYLVERHVLINWTPECEEFALAYLVLYPLAQPTVLNTFMQWPRGATATNADEDAMSLLLRLSRAMDDLCQPFDHDHPPEDDHPFAVEGTRDDHNPCSSSHPLFQALEEQVCQLQVVTFPSDAKEQVTFALNLFNLIARHVMMVASTQNWTWPTSLHELQAFQQHIGYDIGGQVVTLAYLQDSLYGSKDDEAEVPLVARTPSCWSSSCWSSTGSAPPRDLHFERRKIQTDCRILFATSWGCRSSPVTSTIYPNRLDEGLRAASELYCQQQVVIQGRRVILPPLLSWYRADFGTDATKVVKAISRFLSPDQLESMVELSRQVVPVDVVFGEDFDWQPGMMTPKDGLVQTSTPCDDTTVAGYSLVSKASSFVSRVSKVVKRLPRLGRQVSEGDSQVKPLAHRKGYADPAADLRPTAASPSGRNDIMFRACYFNNNNSDDNESRGPADTVVSALTVGSEFEEIRFRSTCRSKAILQRL